MDTNITARTSLAQAVLSKVTASGTTVAQLARETGIAPTTLRRKLAGKSEFAVSELIVIAESVNADATEWVDMYSAGHTR